MLLAPERTSACTAAGAKSPMAATATVTTAIVPHRFTETLLSPGFPPAGRCVPARGMTLCETGHLRAGASPLPKWACAVGREKARGGRSHSGLPANGIAREATACYGAVAGGAVARMKPSTPAILAETTTSPLLLIAM